MSATKISWADVVWNPLAGCTPVSAGCHACYAAREAIRLAGNPNARIAAKYEGTARMTGDGPNRRAVFTGRVNIDAAALELPLRARKPRRWFVNSMSDLFHPAVSDALIHAVFAVMASAREQTFLILTKRPERMAALLSESGFAGAVAAETGAGCDYHVVVPFIRPDDLADRFPLPNVWLGTSCEDQDAAEERIPHLLRTPATVRFLSCEPLLGPVDLGLIGTVPKTISPMYRLAGDMIDWVICGGESGPKARPCDVAWIRSLVQECQSAAVPVFVKQLGANVRDRNDAGFEGDLETYVDDGAWVNPSGWPHTVEVEHDPNGYRQEYQGAPVRVRLRDRKGGNMAEWPEDLRVQEVPSA